MIHGFSEKEWDEYLEGSAEEAMRDRFEAHLIGCLSCWELHDRLAETTGRLRAASRQTRLEISTEERSLRHGLQAVFEKLGREEHSSRREIQEKLDALAAVLAPMCGSGTARKALRAAALDSPARSLDHVTAENWAPFLARLKSIATVMCGETGAHLVWESGQL